MDAHPPNDPIQEPADQRPADATLATPDSFLRPAPVHANKPRIDPWAHRRAEPRPFALMWTGYLLLATIACLGPITAAMFLTPEIYRPAATLLLGATALGVGVFWPMVRLSQDIPAERPSRSVALDMVAVFFPLQATIWPQIFPALSDWDAPIAVAISLHCTAWLAVTGSVLALAMCHLQRLHIAGRPCSTARTLWTVVFLALSLAASLIALVASRPTSHGAVPTTATLWAAAPGVFEITRDRSWLGRPAAVQPEHWRSVLIVFFIASALWTLVLLVERIGRRGYAPAVSDQPSP